MAGSCSACGSREISATGQNSVRLVEEPSGMTSTQAGRLLRVISCREGTSRTSPIRCIRRTRAPTRNAAMGAESSAMEVEEGREDRVEINRLDSDADRRSRPAASVVVVLQSLGDRKVGDNDVSNPAIQ